MVHTPQATRARQLAATAVVTCLFGALLAGSAWVPAAAAGTFTLASCPGDSGWSQNPPNGQYMGYSDGCAAGGASGIGIAMGPNPGSYPPNSSGGMTFTVPTGMSISSYSMSLSAFAGGCVISGGCVSGFANVWVNHSGQQDPDYDFRDLGNGTQNAAINVTSLSGVTWVAIGVGCDPGAGGYSCPGSQGGGPEATATVTAADFQIASAATPTASGFGGTLLTPNAHGTATVAFSASDPAGPGIYKVAVLVDGQALYNATPNTNAGACASAGTDATSGTPIFRSLQPCPASEAVDIPIDTTALRDGTHELKVIVTDAAQNTSTVLDQTITTNNLTTVSARLNSPLPPSAAPPSKPPAPTTYTALLDPASASLQRGVFTTYTKSGLTLSGIVRTSTGVAAPGVTVSLLAQAGSPPIGPANVVAQTTSDATGRWVLHAPLGLSRLLQVVYGNPAQVTPASTLASVRQTVQPGLTLFVKSHAGVLHFTGRLTPVWITPSPAIVIEVQRGGHTAQSVGLPVYPKHDGTYSLTYDGGPPTIGQAFTFRAITVAPNGQYARANSPWQRVEVH